jgi:hypothetical protein
VELLQARVLVRPTNFHEALRRCVAFGLREIRRYGPFDDPHGVVYATGGGMLEVSAQYGTPPQGVTLWFRVPDVAQAVEELCGNRYEGVMGEIRLEPWGLWECTVELFEGVDVIMVEVPTTHPLHWRP